MIYLFVILIHFTVILKKYKSFYFLIYTGTWPKEDPGARRIPYKFIVTSDRPPKSNQKFLFGSLRKRTKPRGVRAVWQHALNATRPELKTIVLFREEVQKKFVK